MILKDNEEITTITGMLNLCKYSETSISDHNISIRENLKADFLRMLKTKFGDDPSIVSREEDD